MVIRERGVIVLLYFALVRSHQKYFIQACVPQHEKDAELLVQRRAKKTIQRLNHLSYDERLWELGLFSLEKVLGISHYGFLALEMYSEKGRQVAFYMS